MRLITFSILFLFISNFLFSQNVTFRWADQIGSSAGDAGQSITTDISGNVITTGSFQATVDFDPGPAFYNLTPFGSNDIFIAKHDNNGNLLWAKQLGSKKYQGSYGIITDPNGNIYVTGGFSGTLDCDPGPGIYNLSSFSNGSAIFIIKLDSNGNFVWAKKVGDSFYSSTGYSIALDPAGNVYTSGIFQGMSDFDPGPAVFNLNSTAVSQEVFFLKLDNNGNFIWAKQFDGTSVCYSIAVDANQNLYATGLFYQACDFDPGPGIVSLTANNLTPGNWSDVYVCKLDINGNLVWVKQMGGQLGDVAQSIAVDLNGNVYTTGKFQGLADYDPGPGTYNLSGGIYYSTFISKLDNNGNFIWAKEFGDPTAGGCEGYAIFTDISGDVYTTGIFYGKTDFDPGLSTYNLQADLGGDLFISKLDGNGNFIFTKQIGGTSFDLGVSMNIDALKNIYITGYFFNQVDFDPGPLVYNLNDKGIGDGYVLKLSQCTPSLSSISVNACNSYVLNNQVFTASGTYTQTLLNATGCDSIITLNLHIGGSSDTTFVTACGSYNWQGQTILSSGNYSVKFSAADGCDSVLNLVLVIKNKIFTKISRVICQGDSFTGYTKSGIYTDIYTAMNGCDSTRVLDLTVNPASFSTTNINICQGNTFWGYSQSGTYNDTLVSANGCDSIRILHLLINPVKSSTVTTSICEGDSYFAAGAYQNVSGLYRDTLFTTAGCDSIIITALTVNPKPAINLGSDKDLCQGSFITLNPGVFNKYQWQDQTVSPTYVAKKAGIYWVKVTDNNNCVASDTIVIKNILHIPSDFLKQTDSICQYENLVIYPAGNFINYLWSTGSTQSSFLADAAGTYILTVQDINGCKGADTITIIQKNCFFGVYIPTAFTPNGDQLNDIFSARVYGSVISFQLKVFNRFGEMIFSSTDPLKGWDGKVKSNPADTGVFVWLCSYHLQGGTPVSKKGIVTLLR